MRTEHVRDGWWELPGAPSEHWPGTKNGRSHRVWLPEAVRDVINGTGYVFGNPKMRLGATMRRACQAAGIADTRPHDLRRSFGTLVTRLGFGRAAMDRLLNHADNSVGSIYDRYSYADEDRAVVQKIANHIFALVFDSSRAVA